MDSLNRPYTIDTSHILPTHVLKVCRSPDLCIKTCMVCKYNGQGIGALVNKSWVWLLLLHSPTHPRHVVHMFSTGSRMAPADHQKVVMLWGWPWVNTGCGISGKCQTHQWRELGATAMRVTNFTSRPIINRLVISTTAYSPGVFCD